MSRINSIIRHIDTSKLGVEVAPYFAPIVAKRDGGKIMSLDIFDENKLREMARNDPSILTEWVDRIEPVDIVGDASNIGHMIQERGLSGKIAYIVSSHNFEHLPNPIKFLRGCSTALEVGGILSMAVPDCRACFDHFRMPTRLSDWIGAFHRDDKQPNAETLLDFWANQGAYVVDGKNSVGCDIKTGQLDNFIAVGDLQSAYGRYLQEVNHQPSYTDAHCTVMFPETLELLLRDCAHLGLIDLEIIEISQTAGLEFYVHLRKTTSLTTRDAATYLSQRQDLLRRISRHLGAAPFLTTQIGVSAPVVGTLDDRVFNISAGIKSGLRAIFGQAVYQRVRTLNKARLARRHRR